MKIRLKEILEWLGISWDKSFKQSDRLHIYDKKIQYLKDNKIIIPMF